MNVHIIKHRDDAHAENHKTFGASYLGCAIIFYKWMQHCLI